MSDVPVNVESPEDRERALAIERAEVARTIQAQVQANEAAQWTQHIEPDARHYYETNQRAEIALLLSIAISLMRTAGNKPYPGTEPEPQADDELPVARAVVKRVRGKMAERAARGEGADNPDSVRAKIRTRVGKRYGSAAEGRKQPRKHK